MPQAPQPLQSPLQKRSEYLARILEQSTQQQPIAGYGDLGARLLAQALTQRASEKTDRALADTQYNADLKRRQELGAAIGVPVQGDAREVGNGRLGNPLAGIVDFLTGKREEPQSASVQPQPAFTPTNTQEPQVSPVAPIAPVEGAPLPAQGQAPTAPQAPAPNPLGPSEQERLLIGQYLNGTPEQVAVAEKMIQEIQLRQAAPEWTRDEFQAVNGVPGTFNQTRGWRPQEGGIPQEAQSQTFVAGENNEYAVPAGTLMQRSPSGVVSVVNAQPAGYERSGNGLRPIAGGPQDQTSGDRGLGNVRQLRTDFRRETEAYREARQGYLKVQQAARDNTGASDIALIFGFMKTLDPGSTVREGEFATAQNTGSIPERVQAAYNRALQGERLTPQQRAEFANTAATQFSTYQQSYDDTVASYQAIAQQYGFDPSLVFGETSAPAPQRRQPQRQSAPQRQPQSNGQRRRYNPRTGRIE